MQTIVNDTPETLYINNAQGQPVAVILPIGEYLRLQELAQDLEALEDLEDIADMQTALADYRQGNAVPAEEVFAFWDNEEDAAYNAL